MLPIAKLEQLVRHYGDLEELLCRPDVLSDRQKLNKLNKERSDLEALVGAFARYRDLDKRIHDDEEALVDALTSGAIAGAGLDVFAQEPLPVGHPFRQLPNVLATPHIGYVTDENYRSSYPQIVENIMGFLDGKPARVIG